MVGLQLNVSGRSAQQRSVVRHAIRWFEHNHLLKPPLAEVSLQVGLVHTLEEAGCVEESVSDERGRRFHMQLDAEAEGLSMLLVTVMHEMVHVNQMLTRRLELNSATHYRAFWNGRDYTETPYSRQPWERQAYRIEWPLLNSYCVEQRHKVFRADECVCSV